MPRATPWRAIRPPRGSLRSLLTRILTVAAGTLVLISAVTISFVVIVIVLTALIVIGLYVWWKTQDLRCWLEEHMNASRAGAPRGEVIHKHIRIRGRANSLSSKHDESCPVSLLPGLARLGRHYRSSTGRNSRRCAARSTRSLPQNLRHASHRAIKLGNLPRNLDCCELPAPPRGNNNCAIESRRFPR